MKSLILTLLGLTTSLLLAVCSFPSYAEAQAPSGQTLQLDDGTWVRYFTIEQARELAERILAGEQCADHLSLVEQQLELRSEQVEDLSDSVEILQGQLEISESYISSVDETVDQLFDRLRRRQRFLFCSSPACTYSVGFVLGAGTVLAIAVAIE